MNDINPIDALRASGLNPIIIDENTDFSALTPCPMWKSVLPPPEPSPEDTEK